MSRIEFIEEQRRVAVVFAEPGQTLLDASLAAGIPHYHVCGGLGQCSTCRVLVLEGGESFGPRTSMETVLAQKRRWPDTIRLACQVCPTGPAKVRRLINDDIDADLTVSETAGWPAAEEREMAILFCDIEGFTSIAERHLPYDVIHTLNRFFKQVGDPILANGGVINKYMGDGLLALFGMDGATREECSRRAIRAGLRILANARNLNRYLEDHFGFSFHPRVGIHFGSVLVGQIGHPEKIDFTVIGDAVNTASRIEAANKIHGTRILASGELVAPLIGSLQTGKVFEDTELRGRKERLRLYEITGFSDTDTVFLVQSTFEQIAPVADAFAQTFYRHLFELKPELEALFAETDMVTMRRMLMRMIGLTVRGLPELFPQFGEPGARHVGYGVKPEYYPIAGEALIYALGQHLGADFIPEVAQAWQDVFTSISTAMLEGTSAPEDK